MLHKSSFSCFLNLAWRSVCKPSRDGQSTFVSSSTTIRPKGCGSVGDRKPREMIGDIHQSHSNIYNGHKPSILASMHHSGHTCSGIMHPVWRFEPFCCRQRSLCPENRPLPIDNVRNQISRVNMEAVMHLLRPPMLFVGLGVVCDSRPDNCC